MSGGDLSWVTLINNVGVPVAFLCAIAYAVFKGVSFLGPRFTLLIEAHLKLLDSLDKQMQSQTDILRSLSDRVSRHDTLLHEIHSSVVRQRGP